MRALPLLAVAVLAALPASAARRAGVAARLTAPPPVIDGALQDWNPGIDGLASPIEVTRGTSVVEEGKIDSDADQSIELYTALDDTALYLAALVTDDAVVAQHRQGEMWRGDMVEVLIANGRGDYLHVGVNPAGDAFVYHPAGPASTAQRLGIQSAARVAAPGYALELRIPRAAFGLVPGQERWRVNFAARDADPGETPPGHRTWSGQRHNLLASFGTLVLEPKTPAPPRLTLRCPHPAAEVRVDRPLRARGTALLAGETPVRLQMLNYQSATPSWDDFWTRWDLAQVRQDLDRAQRLNVNSLRIFIFFGPFGGRRPTAEMMSRAAAPIDEAARRGMVTVVSFFPFDKDFRPERYDEMADHLRDIVARYRGDPAIAMWDLMNEPDHMWMKPESGVKPAHVAAWAERMAKVVREADPTHLVTVGLAGHYVANGGPVKAEEALPLVDVQSIHWYFGLDRLTDGLARAKRAMERPLILQEFGVTGLLYDEDAASAQYAQACEASRKADLAGFAAWELYDHPVGSIRFVDQPWKESQENYFGLLRADGTPRKQAQAFCQCLDAPRLKVVREERSIRVGPAP